MTKNNTNKNIVILGSLTQDLFVYANGNSVITQSDENGESEFYAIPHGGKLTAKYLERHIGGGGANVGVSLQRLGFQSYIFGARGNDEVGEFIEKKLLAENINTKNIQVFPNTESGFSVILNSYQGERTVIFTSQANKKFDKISKKNIEEIFPKAIYLCHISSNSENILLELSKYLEEVEDVIFAWNPGKERLELGLEKNKFLLKNCDFLFLNKEEAELLTGMKAKNPHETHGEKTRNNLYILPDYVSDVSELSKKILETGVKTVVITDGRKGVQVFTKNTKVYKESLGGERVDTLGAGDSFASAFTASILLGKSLEEATEYARINAQSVVAHRGAQDGLLTSGKLYKNI